MKSPCFRNVFFERRSVIKRSLLKRRLLERLLLQRRCRINVC